MASVEERTKLLETGEYSDFVINVDGRKFNVHRNIICLPSKVLHSMCAGNFKEATDGGGYLPEADADTFERVLEFLYTGDYNIGKTEQLLILPDETAVSDVEESSNSILGAGAPIDAQLSEEAIALLEKYKMQSMLESASLQEERLPPEELLIHAEVYLLAKFLDVEALKEYAKTRFADFVKADFRAEVFLEPFTRVFDHGDDGVDGLREQIFRLCVENLHRIPDDSDLGQLLSQHEPIGWKLLMWREKHHEVEHNDLLSFCTDLTEKLEVSQEATEELRESEAKLTLNQNATLAGLKEHNDCRNCRKEFGAYVDKDRGDIVRCKSCLCKHYLDR